MKITVAVVRSFQILLLVLGWAACSASATDLSQPVTLIASPSLDGSGYSETVLFAAPLSNGMHIGFIVNRPSEVALARAFPEHAVPVYFGGPVMPDIVFAVVPTRPNDTEDILQLMPGIVLVLDGDAIDRIIETTPNEARYFAGLIVWDPGELDEEVRAGAWDVVPADASAVFSTHPETLWKTLSRGGPRLEARGGQTQPGEREIGFMATAAVKAAASIGRVL